MLISHGHGYSLMLLYQPDVWEDKLDWRRRLQLLLEQHPDTSYISREDAYKHKSLRDLNLLLIAKRATYS